MTVYKNSFNFTALKLVFFLLEKKYKLNLLSWWLD